MRSTKLYDEYIHGTRITLAAERNEQGRLVIAGQDIGRAPDEFFGRDDYEYWYRLSSEAERALHNALRADLTAPAASDASTEDLLRQAFRSRLFDSPTDLRPYLEEHAIEYDFSSF